MSDTSTAPWTASARAALDSYFRAFNARDNRAVADACNHPRMMIGANGMAVTGATPTALDMDFAALAAKDGWHHSELTAAEPVLVSSDLVYFRIRFQRCRADGTPYRQVEAIYGLTCKDGHWGLQFQSAATPPEETPLV